MNPEALLQLNRDLLLLLDRSAADRWPTGAQLGLVLTLTALLLAGLRGFDGRRFPKNFLLIGLATWLAASAALLAGVLAAPAAGIRGLPSATAAAAFACASGLIYAFRSPARWLFLPIAGVAAIAVGGEHPLEVASGALVGAALAVVLLRRSEIYHGLASPARIRPRGPRPVGPLRVMMVAGEASADVYGARILAELKALEPKLEAFGIGGEALRLAGLQLHGEAHRLSIVGFTAVLGSLRTVVRLYRRMFDLLHRARPDVLVCIDLPDFNLMLAQQARAAGTPVLFDISPQFWAWRAQRVDRIAARITKMVVAFPFEAPFYERAGVPVAFHGHPLLEILQPKFDGREEALRHFGLDPARKTLVLAPGSRGNELAHVGDELFAAGAQIQRERPDWQIAVPLAPDVSADAAKHAARAAGVDAVFTRGDNFDLFQSSEFGVICSGTATLEAALAGLPIAIVYRGNWLNMFLARRLVRIDQIGLPNIVLGESAAVFPEFIQEKARAAPLAAAVLDLLGDERRLDALRGACGRVRASLSGGATSRAVAAEILALAREIR